MTKLNVAVPGQFCFPEPPGYNVQVHDPDCLKLLSTAVHTGGYMSMDNLIMILILFAIR